MPPPLTTDCKDVTVCGGVVSDVDDAIKVAEGVIAEVGNALHVTAYNLWAWQSQTTTRPPARCERPDGEGLVTRQRRPLQCIPESVQLNLQN